MLSEGEKVYDIRLVRLVIYNVADESAMSQFRWYNLLNAHCAHNVQLVNLPSEVKTEARFGVSVKFWSREVKSQARVTCVGDLPSLGGGGQSVQLGQAIKGECRRAQVSFLV